MVETTDLCFGYGGQENVLTDFSWTFPTAEMTVVTGASGRGKSTLLYLIGQMLRPTSGGVIWEGETVSGLSDGDRAQWRAAEVGFVFQDAVLDPSRTVLDNVVEGALYARRPRAASREIAQELLHRFDVQTRSDARPGQISGGQAQRVALCRALVKRPSVVLADEPTGNLDAESAAVVWGALHEEAARGATVIVATHHLDQVDAADTVVRL